MPVAKTSITRSVSIWLLSLVLLGVALQSFFYTLLQSQGVSEHRAFWLTHLDELLLGIGATWFMLLLPQTLWRRRLLTTDLWATLTLVFLVLTSFHHASFSWGLQGLRYCALFILTYLAVRPVAAANLYRPLLFLTVIFSSLISLLALIERRLPLFYWSQIIPHFPTNWGWGNFTVIEAQRSVSLLAGPNQLGSFLIPGLIFALQQAFHTKRWERFLWLMASGLIGLGIVASLSRAAWLGAAAALIYLVTARSWKYFSPLIITAILTVLIALGLGLVQLSQQPRFQSLIFHGSSQIEHQTSLSTALHTLASRRNQPTVLLFGSGVGTAGPLSIKTGQASIPESWYLQLLLENGLVSLLAWLAFFGSLIRLSMRRNNVALAAALIGLSVTALFLHTFADNPAVAVMTAIFCAITAATAPGAREKVA